MTNELLQDEIRINPTRTHLYLSEYEKGSDGDSIPIVKKKSLLTMDYLRKMTSNNKNGMEILPPNCRYLEHVNNGSIVVIEEPPAFRTVRIMMNFQREYKKLENAGKLEEYGYTKEFLEKNTQSFNLALPYVIFILYINDSNQLAAGQVYFRVARMRGLSDYLLKAPLTNISDAQYICFGGGGNSNYTLNTAVENSINLFWAASFNTDYTYNYRAYENIAGVNTYMEWHALSQIDPMFIFNVSWIEIPMNIGQAVDEMKKLYKLKPVNDMQYKTLTQIFSKPFDTGMSKKPSPTSRTEFKLFYDVAEGMFLDSKFYIHIGDSFYIKNNKQLCYINSFISFIDSGDIKYVRVEREDGRLIIYRLTKLFKKYLKDRTKDLRYEAEGILKNGLIIKEDDILHIKTVSGSSIYKKVGTIRKNQEGQHEAKIGDGFYILENTEAELFNVDRVEFQNIVLEKGKTYLLGRENNLSCFTGNLVTYNGITTDSRHRLNIDLTYCNTKVRKTNYIIPLNSSTTVGEYKLYEIDNIKPLPPVFRNGRNLFAIQDDYGYLLKDCAFGTSDGVAYEDVYGGGLKRPNAAQIKEFIIGKDKIHIQSFDMDIEFNIGDKVVIADWVNPINMLSVKIIQGFKFTEGTGDIDIITLDKYGNMDQVKYIDGTNSYIYVGKIRKITNEYGKLKSGMKIKSKEAGIPHFPKKDTNIIIGFITDTNGDQPLVLCSNCCTLWYNDVVENFTKINMTSKKWETLPHAAIDVAKIKLQPGDIIKYTGHSSGYSPGCLVFKNSRIKSLKVMDLKHYSSYVDYHTLDNYVTTNTILDCIPNPRIPTKEITENNALQAWPNLHGQFYTCDRSIFCFINDERSVINVQSGS